jgi:xanthine/CO dehydrogenase XdhC/CoxF family maturation factor
VLATVVRVTGSSYGGIGAQMVIRVDGSSVGIVSGGCLETDLALHAQEVHATQASRTVTYDTRGDDEAAWGLGLGCNGLMDVLIEPLDAENAGRIASELAADLEKSAIRLVVCGSGPDAHPLVRFATELDWNVTVVDHRGLEHADRFPGATVLDSLASAKIDDHTAGVVMSHHFERDREYVRALLESSAAYIGVMGPRERFERMNHPSDPRLYAPIGLDIGGRSPDAIALSIITEIASVMNKRSGGHLRDQPTLHN